MTITNVNDVVKQKKVDGLVCVTLDVHLWSGKKRLRKEALIAKNPEFANLPPESLATLGSIKICDTDELAPFLQLKRRAEKLLQLNGLPVLGTTGIPEAKLDKVFAELVKIKAEFDGRAAAFTRRFDAAIEQWRQADENRDWTSLINDVPTPEHVAGRLSFGMHLCRVTPPSEDEHAVVNKMYAKQMSGLKGELFADAAREAEILMTKYLIGADANGVVKKREKVTWKTLRPLVRIGEKFRSFAFLDVTCEPMARMIEHVVNLLPKDGPIEGLSLVHVWSMARMLADPKEAMAVADLAYEAPSAADAFEQILNKVPAAAAVAEQVAVPNGPATEGQADASAEVVHSAERAGGDAAIDATSTGFIPDIEAEEPQFVGIF